METLIREAGAEMFWMCNVKAAGLGERPSNLGETKRERETRAAKKLMHLASNL